MTHRLPIPGSDDGIWGGILNDFLTVSHNGDGSMVSSAVTSVIPDASSSAKGLLSLAGDLAGAATAPIVAKVNGVMVSGTPSAGQVITATGSAAANWSMPVTGGAQALTTTSIKTSAYTAVTGDLIPADATSAAFTVTLPTAPSDKTRIVIKKIDSTSNIVTILTGGSDVFNKTGGSTILSLSVLNQSINLQYTAAASIWYVVGDDLPLSQLDGRYVKQGALLANVKDYGATGNGVTDDSTAIMNAINAVNTAGGGIVYFPTGSYITGQQIIYSNIVYAGEGTGASVVRLKAASNTDLFITAQFSTLTSGTTNGPQKFGFKDITLDANRANQTSTALCARIYGYNYTVYNTWFINGFGGGVYSEWGGSDNPMEVYWDNFKIWNYGGRPGSTGLDWNGPHDSMFSNGIIATLDSTIQSVDVAYGATPVNGSSVTLPAAGTSFTFATTAAASTTVYPTGGGTFVVPIASGVYSWSMITYTSASTSGGVTTFSGCTSLQGAITVTASGGIVVPSYGFHDHGFIEGAGHGGAGEILTAVHVWGRNHFAIYTTSQNFYSNGEAEGGLIANVVFDVNGCVWTGGTIYGTNGQTGQLNETGLQIGQNYGVSRSIVVAFIFNIGGSSGGAPVRMTNTTGDNVLRVAGTTSASKFLNSPFYNTGGDWYEIVCHNAQTLSVYHVPYQPKFPIGLFIGNASNLPSSGGHIYAGSGAPSITNSVAGDYYFRTDTPTTSGQQIYIATASNTWSSITSGGSGGAALTDGGTWAANTAYAQGEVVTDPTGDRVAALAAFTSGSTYNASNWVVLSPQPTISSIPNLSSQLTTALNRGEAISTAAYSGTLASGGTWNSNPLNGLDSTIFGTNPASYWSYQVQATSATSAILQASTNGTSGWSTISTQSSSTVAGQQITTDRGIVPSASPYLQLIVTNGSSSQSVRATFKINGASYSS